jgi:hypothetical protein
LLPCLPAIGALPPGLALDSGSGTVSGTPTAAGVYVFTVSTADPGSGAPRSMAVQITITAGPPGPVNTTTPASVPTLSGLAMTVRRRVHR